MRVHRFLTPLIFLFVIAGIWEGVIVAFDIPTYILARPSAIAITCWSQPLFFGYHMGVTMLEACLGFLLANALGFVVAVVFAHSPTLERGLYPYAIALKTTPIIALAPLLVIWLGTGLASKVAASALICFFPILVNSIKGLQAVDDEALDLFRSLNATRRQIFFKLRFSTCLPYLFSALKISTSLSIVGAVVGEFVGANRGLGFVILVSSYHLEVPKMFAATAASAIGGVAFFVVIALLESKIVFWERREYEL